MGIKPSEQWRAWVKGWKDGATEVSAALKYIERDDELSEAYTTGYANGLSTLKQQKDIAANLYGYDRSALRIEIQDTDYIDPLHARDRKIRELEAACQVREDALYNIRELTKSGSEISKIAGRALTIGAHDELRRIRLERDKYKARAEKLEAELNRRKGDPITRLHNICEGLEEKLPCGHDVLEWCDNCETCSQCADESSDRKNTGGWKARAEAAEAKLENAVISEARKDIER